MTVLRDGLSLAFPQIEFVAAFDHAGALAAIPEAEALFAFGPTLTDELMRAAPRLRWIQALGTGVDGIIDRPSVDARVWISATRGVHARAVADLSMAFMLALARDLPRVHRQQGMRVWKPWPARGMRGMTVAILGVGEISGIVARRCKAFDMNVIGLSRSPRQVDNFDRIEPYAALAGIAAEADFLLLLAPYGPDTHAIVDAPVLAALGPSGYLINVARAARSWMKRR